MATQISFALILANLLVSLNQPCQEWFDMVSLDSICYKNIPLTNIKTIIASNDIPLVKTYIPPEGDTENYDHVLYFENDNIRLTVYELNGIQRLASGTIKNLDSEIEILGSQTKIGQHESSLARFTKSFERYEGLKAAKDSSNPKFHITITQPSTPETGIFTIHFANQLITGISFTLDPA